MEQLDVDAVLAEATLEEKARLLSGNSMWSSPGVARLGVPALVLTDGPHGVRLKKPGTGDVGLLHAYPATCFPTAATLGSTWDVELLERVGSALGREARALGVGVLLGPGINIKRHPLGGRNFEYLSEDPLVGGLLGAGMVRGIQSRGVSACVKHFAVNNQEEDRMRVSAEVDARTLREIYLRAFEIVVKTSQPGTVMCAYNRVNGVYASENRWLLSDVLRGEWGYQGVVVSDWGAVHDRRRALEAGLDLQMPHSIDHPEQQLVHAVEEGSLDQAAIDRSARRVLSLIAAHAREAGDDAVDMHNEHDELAREAAAAGMVLLKNDPVAGHPVLPLDDWSGLLVVGQMAAAPRYQGTGSSQMTPTRLHTPLEGLATVIGAVPTYVEGYSDRDGADLEALRAEAVAAAARARTVVVFVGLPDSAEGEGGDRVAFELPAAQVTLLAELADVCPRTVVVLANGSPVSVAEWSDAVPAVLETWLPGQAGGLAVADVLSGEAEASGRLAETIPVRLQDTPAYLSFPGGAGRVRYDEGVFVGYRWYDSRDWPVAFPFGHGLSYTRFEYDALAVAVEGVGLDAMVEVTFELTNAGSRAGAEVPQLYVRRPGATDTVPRRELRAFAKERLAAGEVLKLSFTLRGEDLAQWDVASGSWRVHPGEIVLEVGASSRDIRLRTVLEGIGAVDAPGPLSVYSTVREWRDHPQGAALVAEQMATVSQDMDEAMEKLLSDIPMLVACRMGLFPLTAGQLEEFVVRGRS
jgi:beta-glucosidase